MSADVSGGGGQGAPGKGAPAPYTAVVVGQLPLRVLPASADRPKPDKPILRRRVSAASPVPDTVVSPPRPRRPVAGRAVLAKRAPVQASMRTESHLAKELLRLKVPALTPSSPHPSLRRTQPPLPQRIRDDLLEETEQLVAGKVAAVAAAKAAVDNAEDFSSNSDELRTSHARKKGPTAAAPVTFRVSAALPDPGPTCVFLAGIALGGGGGLDPDPCTGPSAGAGCTWAQLKEKRKEEITLLQAAATLSCTGPSAGAGCT